MFEIEVVSEPPWPDYEVWTCKECGWSTIVPPGGDVCECPQCIARSESETFEEEQQD